VLLSDTVSRHTTINQKNCTVVADPWGSAEVVLERLSAIVDPVVGRQQAKIVRISFVPPFVPTLPSLNRFEFKMKYATSGLEK